MKFATLIKKVEKELRHVLSIINEKDVNSFVDLILNSKVIFLTGQGRSGLVAQAFAMRLVHLGFESHYVGEATTPNIEKGDLLIAISGSGKTKITNDIISAAKKTKAKCCLITADKKSARKVDLVVEIRAKTKFGKQKSIEPMGSLFEQSCLLYLDVVVLILMDRIGKDESYLMMRHTKME